MNTREIGGAHGHSWGRVGATLALALVALPVLLLAVVLLRLSLLLALPAGVLGLAFSPRLRQALGLDAGELPLEPGELRLHPHHAWVRTQPARAEVLVGADELVQQALGPVQTIDLPPAGTRVAQDEPLFALGRGGRRVIVRSPLSGTVRAVNGRLVRKPELIYQSPYGTGWVLQLKPDAQAAEERALLGGEDACDWLRREGERLVAVLASGPEPTPMLQDGGVLVEELHLQIDDVCWERLRRELFGA